MLPRSVFAAKGSRDFREAIFANDCVEDLTMLLNSAGWVFDDAEPRKDICLVAIERNVPATHRTLALRGPFRSREHYEYGIQQPAVFFLGEQVREWTDSATLPLLPTDKSADVFSEMRKAPRLDLDDGILVEGPSLR